MKVDDKRKTLTIDALTTSWINHAIHPNPEYQRGSTWGRRQQQLLIDSVLRGYPLPRFYFQQKASTDPLGNAQVSLDVIDGQQRLIALSQFRQDMWPLFAIDDPKIPLPPSIRQQPAPWSGKTFMSLSEALQRQFLDIELPVVLIDEVTGDEVRDLFIRLQSGTPLTPQQVRDAWPGNIGPYIERLAGRREKLGQFDQLFKAVDRRGRGQREEEYEDPALDARQTCAQLLVLLLTKERGRGYLTLRSSVLDDLYHENTDFDTKSRVAVQFEQVLTNMQEVIALCPPGQGRRAVRKSQLYSLFLFLRFLRFSPINLPRAVKPIARIFWSGAADDTEPKGQQHRVGSADTLEKHFHWFMDEHMAGLQLPELDPNRLFSVEQKREIWARDNGVCGECQEAVSEGFGEYDHIKPWILGGRTEIDNGRVVHPRCHRRGLAAVDGREAPVPEFERRDS